MLQPPEITQFISGQPLRQQRRNAFELPEGILRRLVEIERCLKIIEPPKTPVLTRRHPVS